MLRDYLTKLAILSQYSGPANALMNRSEIPNSCESGATEPKVSGTLPTDKSGLSEVIAARIRQEREQERQMIERAGYPWVSAELPFGACQTNPAYRGNPGDDR